MVDYHALRLHVQDNRLGRFTVQQVAHHSYFALHYELVIRHVFLFFVHVRVPVTQEFQ
jgi:hypothetical protein